MLQDLTRIQKCCIGQYIQAFNTKSFVQFSNGSQLMFCKEPTYGELGYTFRQVIKRECSWMPKAYGLQYTPLTISAALPPFEKHLYPSFPDSDKKKAIRLSRQTLEEDRETKAPESCLSIIRPCDLDENDEPDRFAGISPLTLGECRTPDEPMPPTPWLTQFHIEL